jgi:hypothetical protein
MCGVLMHMSCTECIDVCSVAGRLASSQYPEGPATGNFRNNFFFLVSLCLKANAEMVPKFPS